MPTMDKLSSHKTAIFSEAGETKVIYQNTCIVKWDGTTITLNSGGWKTVTTKRKMQQASNQFDLGYSVFQKKGSWYVILPTGETIDFTDGMTFKA